MGKITKEGYTIIEILVAVSISAVIFVAGFANFRDFSRRQVLVSAVRSLKGDLRLAQEYALIGKKPEEVKCLEPNILDTYGFYVNNVGEYMIRAYCSGGAVDVKVVEMAQDVEILTPNPNPITFKVLGEGNNLSASTDITLSQVSTGDTLKVTVSPGGEIK